MTGPTSVLQIGRIADDEFVHGARKHLEHGIGDIFLQKQQTQR